MSGTNGVGLRTPTRPQEPETTLLPRQGSGWRLLIECVTSLCSFLAVAVTLLVVLPEVRELARTVEGQRQAELERVRILDAAHKTQRVHSASMILQLEEMQRLAAQIRRNLLFQGD